ncbi:MAG TPA: DnaJ C-terminal domain-containing protein [Caulobacteraceae bacterium]|jgi:curved DNA-binding protein
MSAATLTADQARALLGLAPDASPHDVIGAFRAAAKQAHPDRLGGDPERFREILAAYRHLQSLPRLPATIPVFEAPVVDPFVEIGPRTALEGGEADAVLSGGRRQRIRVPAGARHGERLTAGDDRVQVRIVCDASMQVRGSDLWVTAELSVLMLKLGGRVTVETPLGPKTLWISRKAGERGLVRLEGQGLPSRDAYPQGCLFIRLVPDVGAPESAARAQLRKFAAAWAA